MKSARHFSREGEEKEDGGSMKGRKLQGEKHKKEVALLLSGWLCGRLTGAGRGLLSPGTPHMEPGVRNFLEILKLRTECGYCVCI